MPGGTAAPRREAAPGPAGCPWPRPAPMPAQHQEQMQAHKMECLQAASAACCCGEQSLMRGPVIRAGVEIIGHSIKNSCPRTGQAWSGARATQSGFHTWVLKTAPTQLLPVGQSPTCACCGAGRHNKVHPAPQDSIYPRNSLTSGCSCCHGSWGSCRGPRGPGRQATGQGSAPTNTCWSE
jgi:hypothetical protein